MRLVPCVGQDLGPDRIILRTSGTQRGDGPTGIGPSALSVGVTDPDTWGMARRLAASVVAMIGLLGVLALPQAALAHDDETDEGYLLVQQALGHLAHDTSSDGIDMAMEKIDDALATEDQEGVNVAELHQGMQVLEAGQVAQARALLQESIQDALSSQPPATGYETGTTVVPSALPGRAGLSGQDVGWLMGSFALVGLGLMLAYRFRPRDSVRALRVRLKAEGPADGETAKSPDTDRWP